MSTYDTLNTGDTFTTRSRSIDAELAATLVQAGGYTHPLFTDPAFAASSRFGRAPLPGQAVLLLMGGLIEQTDRFDDSTIALVGLDDVVFAAPAFVGDELHVVADVLSKEPHPTRARGTIAFRWTCRNAGGVDVVVCTARMVFRIAEV